MAETLYPCSRCGKPRTIAKSWEETEETSLGRTSTIKYTRMVCPDPECQKLVDEEVSKKEEKRAAAVQAKEERLQRAYYRPKPDTEATSS